MLHFAYPSWFSVLRIHVIFGQSSQLARIPFKTEHVTFVTCY